MFTSFMAGLALLVFTISIFTVGFSQAFKRVFTLITMGILMDMFTFTLLWFIDSNC